MGFTLKAHEHVKKQGPVSEIILKHPYIRLTSVGQPTVFLQHGHIYSENGQEYPILPGWAHDHFQRLTAKALESVGFTHQIPKKIKAPKVELKIPEDLKEPSNFGTVKATVKKKRGRPRVNKPEVSTPAEPAAMAADGGN